MKEVNSASKFKGACPIVVLSVRKVRDKVHEVGGMVWVAEISPVILNFLVLVV